MSVRCLFVLVLSLGAADASRGDDPTKKDSTSLQGTWKVVAGWRNGEQMPAEKASAMELVVEGDKLIIKEKGKKSDEDATFKLDPSKKPASIDIMPRGRADRTVPGIYELKGDDLKLAWVKGGKEARPTSFDSKPESRVIVWVLKREKK